MRSICGMNKGRLGQKLGSESRGIFVKMAYRDLYMHH